jgi:hypothetical protein
LELESNQIPITTNDSSNNNNNNNTIETRSSSNSRGVDCFFPDLEALRMTATRIHHVDAQPIRGVLWKRRDVFMNSWRPRWFDLQPEQGLLTYYLLSSNNNTSTSSGTTSNTPMDHTPPYLRSSSMVSASNSGLPTSMIGPLPREMLRSRATSWDSAISSVSENSVDYDVVPRGSIYLWGGGCTVTINENLSKPSEHLYAFSIRTSDRKSTVMSDFAPSIPVDAASTIHLAARTPELRDEWVRKINNVCTFGQAAVNMDNNNVRVSPVSNVRRRSNSRGRLQQEPFLQLQEPILEETNADIYSHGGGDIDENFSEHSSPPRTSSCQQQRSDTTDDHTRQIPNTIGPWERDDIFNQNSTVYDTVPDPIAIRIREKIQTFLTMLGNGEVFETNISNGKNNNPDLQWKRLNTRKKTEHKDLNLSAYQCRYTEKVEDTEEGKTFSILRSEAILPNPAKQIFNLVSDITRRMEYENNIQTSERMKRFNHHTSLDYYASTAVWPTAAREFIGRYSKPL